LIDKDSDNTLKKSKTIQSMTLSFKRYLASYNKTPAT